MSSKQVNYTQLSNTVLDALIQAPLTVRQYKVCLAIIRKTIGYNKASDDISVSQLSEVTGVQKNHIYDTLQELKNRQVLTVLDGQYGFVLSVNTNVKNWDFDQKTTPKIVSKKPIKSQLRTPNLGLEKAEEVSPNLGLNSVPTWDQNDSQLGTKTSPNLGHNNIQLDKIQTQNTTPKDNVRTTQPKTSGFSVVLMMQSCEGLSESVATDFSEYRKKKKAPINQTIWTKICEEIKKSGMSANDALTETMLAGWQGVKAEWLINRASKQSNIIQLNNRTNYQSWQSKEDERKAFNSASMAAFLGEDADLNVIDGEVRHVV